jgi:hypothetical protein
MSGFTLIVNDKSKVTLVDDKYMPEGWAALTDGEKVYYLKNGQVVVFTMEELSRIAGNAFVQVLAGLRHATNT